MSALWPRSPLWAFLVTPLSGLASRIGNICPKGPRCLPQYMPEGAPLGQGYARLLALPRIGPADTTLYMPSGAPSGHELSDKKAKPIDNAHICLKAGLKADNICPPPGPLWLSLNICPKGPEGASLPAPKGAVCAIYTLRAFAVSLKAAVGPSGPPPGQYKA